MGFDWGQMSILGDVLSTVGGMANTAISNRTNILLQKEAWEREDTAVQRRVKDLEAAGLNPVLAAGSAAESSSPVKVESMPTLDPGIVSRAAAAKVAAANYARTNADTARVMAEVGLINEQKEKAIHEGEKAAVEAAEAAQRLKIRNKMSDQTPFPGVNLMETEELLKVLQAGTTYSLTGTNLESSRTALELLKEFGYSERTIELALKNVDVQTRQYALDLYKKYGATKEVTEIIRNIAQSIGSLKP